MVIVQRVVYFIRKLMYPKRTGMMDNYGRSRGELRLRMKRRMSYLVWQAFY